MLVKLLLPCLLNLVQNLRKVVFVEGRKGKVLHAHIHSRNILAGVHATTQRKHAELIVDAKTVAILLELNQMLRRSRSVKNVKEKLIATSL